MSNIKKDHVVTTCGIRPNGSVVQHAYGPFTKFQAQAFRTTLLREEVPEGYMLHVAANKIIDLKAMNDENKKAEWH